MRGALALVATRELVALELEVAQMPAQAVQLVGALRRFGAELAHGGGRGLPDGAEPAFEVETRQPLLEGADLIEQGGGRGIPFRFHALDDRALDIVQGERGGGGLFPGGPLPARLRPPAVA